MQPIDGDPYRLSKVAIAIHDLGCVHSQVTEEPASCILSRHYRGASQSVSESAFKVSRYFVDESIQRSAFESG
jgi:hypothetical protein